MEEYGKDIESQRTTLCKAADTATQHVRVTRARLQEQANAKPAETHLMEETLLVKAMPFYARSGLLCSLQTVEMVKHSHTGTAAHQTALREIHTIESSQSMSEHGQFRPIS